MRKDAQKEDRTIVNHYHGFSSSTEDRRNVCKDTIEHNKKCTGAQNLMFLYDLKDNYCNKDARLEVDLHVKSCRENFKRGVSTEKCRIRAWFKCICPNSPAWMYRKFSSVVHHRGNFVHDIPP